MVVVGRQAGLKDGEKVQTKMADSWTERRANRMSRFAIKTPYFIVVICLVVVLLGIVSIVRMPVDLFPAMNIPVVAVATFYSGMPPEQIEGNITYHLERFFTLASGIDHMESRSLTGVSLIKVYFQPGTNPGFGGDHDRQPGDGGDQPPAAGHAAALRAQDWTPPACRSAW